jgi:hypothetical protein
MDYSVSFGTKNTWTDWHLTPTSRPVINPPDVKSNYTEVPGGDGSVDTTESMTGRPVYGTRTGTLDFYVENGFKPWDELYSEIMNYLHGQSMQMILSDDTDHYYIGRYTVNAWKSEEQRSMVTIGYTVAPYKFNTAAPPDEWLWDGFSFLTGRAKRYKNLPVTGTLVITVTGFEKLVPLVTVASAPMALTLGGVTYQVPKGVTTLNDVLLSPGENEVTITGNGVISLVYTGGSL